MTPLSTGEVIGWILRSRGCDWTALDLKRTTLLTAELMLSAQSEDFRDFIFCMQRILVKTWSLILYNMYMN